MVVNFFDKRKEIEKKFRDAVQSQKEEIIKSYFGLEIDNWTVNLSDVSKVHGDDIVIVSCSFGDEPSSGNFWHIHFEFKLSKCPELKLAKRDQEIFIKKSKIDKIEYRINKSEHRKDGILFITVGLTDCDIYVDLPDTDYQKEIQEKMSAENNKNIPSYSLIIRMSPNWDKVYKKIYKKSSDEDFKEHIKKQVKNIDKNDLYGSIYEFTEYFDSASGLTILLQRIERKSGEILFSNVWEFGENGCIFNSDENSQIFVSESGIQKMVMDVAGLIPTEFFSYLPIEPIFNFLY